MLHFCLQIKMAQRVFRHQILLWLDACRSKCVSYVLRCVLARRSSIQMRFLCAQMRSRSTPVDPNAFPLCSIMLSLDACRPKGDSYVVKCKRMCSPRMCSPRTKHLAELSQAERSEAPARSAAAAEGGRPSEARPRPSEARRYPELREGFKRKLECDPTGSVFCRGV